MKAGDTAYMVTYSGALARVTCKKERRYDWITHVDEWIIGSGPGPRCAPSSSQLRSTLTAALAWLIERTESRLAEQEQEAAQTRETLGELRGMLEGVEG